MLRPTLAATLALLLLSGQATAQTKHLPKTKKPKAAPVSQGDFSSLTQAVQSGKLTLVKQLLAKGTKIGKTSTILCDIGGEPKTRLAIAKLLVAKGANVNAAEQSNPNHVLTPLEGAIFGGEDAADLVKYLIAKGADVNPKLKDGMTPLRRAVMASAPTLVRILLKNHANPNSRQTYVDPFETDEPIPEGLLDGMKRDIAEIVSHHYEPNYRFSGTTPLVELRFRWSPEVAKALVDGGADIKAVDDNGWSLLHYAAAADSTEMMNFFLAKGLDINAESKLGFRPLHLATRAREGGPSSQMVKLLLDHGADKSLKDKEGNTPDALLRQNSVWVLQQILTSTEPQFDGDAQQTLTAFNNTARLLDPVGSPITMPGLPTDEFGIRYQPVMLTMLHTKRSVRIQKDHVTLTLTFDPIGIPSVGVIIDELELQAYETTTRLPRVVELDPEAPTYVQFEFPTGASKGGALTIKFRLTDSSERDLPGEFNDFHQYQPIVGADESKKGSPVEVLNFCQDRTMIFRIDEATIDGKPVAAAKGKEYTVPAGGALKIKEVVSRLNHPLTLKYSYRYTPNVHWHSDEYRL